MGIQRAVCSPQDLSESSPPHRRCKARAERRSVQGGGGDPGDRTNWNAGEFAPDVPTGTFRRCSMNPPRGGSRATSRARRVLCLGHAGEERRVVRPGSRNLREARQTTSIESLRSVPSLVGLPAAFAGSVIVLFRRASSPRSPVQVPLSSPRSNPLASGQTPSTGPLPAGSEIRRTALVRRTRFAALTPTARFPHHPRSDPMRHPSARESGCCDRRWRSAFGGSRCRWKRVETG